MLVFIDDATSSFMQLRLVASESTGSHFEALNGSHDAWLPNCFLLRQAHGLSGEPTGCEGRFGHDAVRRALAELNIEILWAYSIQAKGRVERANRTLQDRLVKELRMACICDMNAGNSFLPKVRGAVQRQVGLRTVQRWIQAGVFPERMPRRYPHSVNAYADLSTHACLRDAATLANFGVT